MSFIQSGAESMVQQTLSPAWLRQIAKQVDPYVRDTSDSDYLTGVLKKQVVQYWPMFRTMLPVEYDLTGEPRLQSDAYGWGHEESDTVSLFLDTYFNPTNTVAEKNDPELIELLDMSYRTGDTSCLPTVLVSTTGDHTFKVSSSVAKQLNVKAQDIRLSDDEARLANQLYGSYIFNGWDGVKGLRAQMNGVTWKHMDDAARVKAVSKMMSSAKIKATKDILSWQ